MTEHIFNDLFPKIKKKKKKKKKPSWKTECGFQAKGTRTKPLGK